jgi:chloride channel protein, CIC family
MQAGSQPLGRPFTCQAEEMDTHPKSGFSSKLKRLLEGLRQNENQLAIVLSLVIGALVGLVIVAFILLTGRLAARMYPPGGAGWHRILVPTLGSLVTGYLLWRYFPLARGSGIPQTKFALFVNDGRISFRTVVGKFICCSTSLASGIALGREGPSAHIGAGLASVIGRGLGLSQERVKALVPVGCSAALAAAFNTPIAGVLFSLEEVMGDLHASVLGTTVLSSATSWMVLHLVLGDDPLFHVSGYRLVHPAEFGVYAVLGVVGGLGSVCFVKLLLGLRLWFMRLPKWSVWLQPVIGGLSVGLIGYFVPEVMGVGYNYVEKVLNGDMVLQVVVLLAVLKIVATAVCYSSGNAGGIFGPSLFIGAMMGGAVGSVAHYFLPTYTAGPGAYALVGMGAAFAGIVRTPLTSVIMIFEMTRDYTIIVPLMISNLIAFFISQRFQRIPIYEALADQDGVHLPTAESRSNHGRIRIAQVMRASNGDSAATLEEILGSKADAKRFPHVHPDHTLNLALERMGAAKVHVLPVVSRANVRQLLGVVVLEDVLEAYGVGRPSASQDYSE